MESQICPICHEEMEMEHMITYIDFHCKHHRDHHFGKRLRQSDKELDRVKLRVTDSNGEKLYIQIYFQDGYCEVWKHNCTTKRYRINHTFVPDYSNLDSIMNKIRTYLTFG